MKKIKLFSWAMMVLMCLSFSGCGATSGSEGDTITQLMLAKFDSHSTSLTDINGTKLIPSDPSVLYTLTEPGIYQFTVAYDPNTVSDGQVKVTFNSDPTSIMNPFGVIPEEDFIKDYNIPLYAIDYQPRQLAPFMFDANYMIIPVVYQCPSIVNDSEINTELGKHRFVLSYDTPQTGDDTLVLHLSDKVTDVEKERSLARFTFQAFDLSSLISYFKAQGNTLKKITVKGLTSDASSDLADAKEETYTFDYNF